MKGGIGRHDNNRLSKAPSTSHTSHYLTRTVQANACEGDFPMMVIKVKTRSGLPHIMEMCSWLRSRQEVNYHIWRCVHTPYPHNVLLPLFQFAWMHTLLPTFFFLPVERGIGWHDNNRLSKALSTSHTSHYLTRTVQANACEGVFPMLVIKVKTRSGSSYPHNVLLPPFQFAWMHTLHPTFFFLPVETGEVGWLDNNRLSKALSSSHTSHYLTRTVQANAYEGDFPMLVLPVAVHVI